MSSPYTTGQLVGILIAAIGVGVALAGSAVFARGIPNWYVRGSMLSFALGFLVASSAIRVIGVTVGRNTNIAATVTTICSAVLGLVLFVIGVAHIVASRGGR